MEDVLMMKILPLLPLKDQFRLKCVSKSWYAALTSLQNQKILLMREVTNKEEGVEIESPRLSFFKYPFTPDDDSCFEHIDCPRLGTEFKYIVLCGHSHGLLCISHGFQGIVLYNPTTGELRSLPPSILIPFTDSDDGFLASSDGIGFGYDPESKDFKVIRAVGYYGGYGRFRPCRAELYDLGKDRWREIKTPVPGYITGSRFCEMYYQGFFYWLASGDDECNKFICVEFIQFFDMSKEVFGRILMPSDICDVPRGLKSLGVLNGSIVLLSLPFGRHEQSFDVWEMVKDDDDGELGRRSSRFSWTKLFKIGPVFGIYSPLAFVGSDQLLMQDDKGQLILCNIFDTQDIKHLPIEGLPTTFVATPFFGTLLSLKGGEKD